MKPLTLSIVIPAYNEETYLGDCLNAIARQTILPDEVIVVNNNSTDRTVEIAASYPFVTVLHENKQGFIPPRNKGFNAATGDIIGRIDVDAILAPDWVERTKTNFANPLVAAVTGPALSLTFSRNKTGFYSRLWPMVYFWWTEAEFGIPVLWGANMAIRRSAWQTIKNDIHDDDTQVHEDQDLSFVLAGMNLLVKRDNKLLISTPGDSYHEQGKFTDYYLRRLLTKQYHHRRKTLAASQLRLTWPSRFIRYGSVIVPGIVFIAAILPYSFLMASMTRLKLVSVE